MRENEGKMRENEGKKVSVFRTEKSFLIAFFLKMKFMVRFSSKIFFSFLQLFFHFFLILCPFWAEGRNCKILEIFWKKIDFFIFFIAFKLLVLLINIKPPIIINIPITFTVPTSSLKKDILVLQIII